MLPRGLYPLSSIRSDKENPVVGMMQSRDDSRTLRTAITELFTLGLSS